MKEIWAWLQAGFAGLGGWIGWFLGGFDGFIYALLVFVMVDYITGVLRAATEKNLSSAVGFKGIIKKVLIFVMVAVSHLVDHNLIGDSEMMFMLI
jgi:toxin secretion/phage lysis holin